MQSRGEVHQNNSCRPFLNREGEISKLRTPVESSLQSYRELNKCPTNFSWSPGFDKLKLVGHQLYKAEIRA